MGRDPCLSACPYAYARETRPWISTLFEALTCSLLSIGICAGLSSLLPAITPQSCVGIGSLIGYLGTDVLKRFFISFISSRTGISPDTKDSDK